MTKLELIMRVQQLESCLSAIMEQCHKAGLSSPELEQGKRLVDVLVPDSNANHSLSQEVERIYRKYPRRRDPRASRIAILRALRDPMIPCAARDRAQWLCDAVSRYALHCKLKQIPLDKTPYPATWFNRQSYLNSLKTQEVSHAG